MSPTASVPPTARFIVLLLISIVLTGMLLAACSSSSDPRPDATTQSAPTSQAPTTTARPEPTTTTVPEAVEVNPPTDEAVVPTSVLEVAADDDLVRRPEENNGTDDGGHWIGRNTMTDTSVEVVWSAIEGTDVVYRIFRTEITADLDRENLTLTDDLLVYEGQPEATTFVDATVETGTFYSYILEAQTDGTVLSRRWANALAVTDTEPPSPITNLSAEVVDGEVVLRWDPSTDNLEFAAYSVSLVVDDVAQYLGGGADPSQASFVDNRPEPGTNIYSVQAVDFHDNRTEEVFIEVVVG